MRNSTLKASIGIITTILVSLQPASGFAKKNVLTDEDRNILNALNQGSLEEVELGALAQKKANYPAVKNFGKRMLKDHSEIKNQVEGLATKEGIQLTEQLTTEEDAMKSDLNKRTGKDFDKRYIQGMLKDHRKDIAELQHYADTSKNPEIRNLARKTLPILENHIRIAENIAGKLGIPADEGLTQPVHPTS